MYNGCLTTVVDLLDLNARIKSICLSDSGFMFCNKKYPMSFAPARNRHWLLRLRLCPQEKGTLRDYLTKILSRHAQSMTYPPPCKNLQVANGCYFAKCVHYRHSWVYTTIEIRVRERITASNQQRRVTQRNASWRTINTAWHLRIPPS